jgi:thymidylate synthase
VYRSGQTVGDETRELRGLGVAFVHGQFEADPLLVRFASAESVAEMRKVFFSTGPNRFGHSYRDKLRGPQGRGDFSDVVELLRREPASKRAVVSLAGPGDGTVPCINVIQFMVRDGGLSATYFARGQDMFRKFYADAVCIYEMAQRVAGGLELPVSLVSGLISSAHIYLRDLAEIRTLLLEVRDLRNRETSSSEARR